MSMNHTSGGASRNARPVNTVDAEQAADAGHSGMRRAGAVAWKQAPTSSPGPAMIAATARKIAGRISQIGGPVVLRLVKKISSLPLPVDGDRIGAR